MSLTPKPGVMDIEAYVPGRSEAAGAARVYKLSSNESPFGPSPKAVAAYESVEAKLGAYPEGSARILREAIAAHYGLGSDRIVCGNGSDEILTLLANSYVRPKDEVLFSAHSFSVYKISTLANSGVPVEVPTRDLRLDIGDMIARVNAKTRLVYLANPNNPTASYVTESDMRRLHAALPDSTLLVIDAAYSEYVRRNDYEAGIELVSTSENVVMTRTFSKAYGLAGIRVGWAYCPKQVADVLNRVRAPFNVNIAAQKAAVAALADRSHVEAVIRHNEIWRDWLIEEIRKAGLRVDDSVANFVLIHFPQNTGRSAADADRFLMARGIILRGCASYDLPQCLRLTVGSEEENRAAVEALAAFMAS
ncbi:MAG: histidinol-phosphate aminotransferase [Alphaproteobacteria bacterium]|jgi:histidinol-phosphate aminotransferase|nr:histidinol-phosphate aminotransferase [Alphaproteobacteria bacterium]